MARESMDSFKDDGLEGDVGRVTELTAEERIIEKQLLRKIDLLIMPTVICVYLMNYIDRLVHLLPCYRKK